VAEAEVAQVAEVSQFSVPLRLLVCWPVAQPVALRYCPRQERCLVAVRSRPHSAGFHLPFGSDVRTDRDVHHAVGPLTPAFQDDSLRRLAAFRFVAFPQCLAAVKTPVSVLDHGKYVCVSDLHREAVPAGARPRQSVDPEYLDAEIFEPDDPSCRPHDPRGHSENDPEQSLLPDRD
jgi:hypothetical protein